MLESFANFSCMLSPPPKSCAGPPPSMGPPRVRSTITERKTRRTSDGTTETPARRAIILTRGRRVLSAVEQGKVLLFSTVDIACKCYHVNVLCCSNAPNNQRKDQGGSVEGAHPTLSCDALRANESSTRALDEKRERERESTSTGVIRIKY